MSEDAKVPIGKQILDKYATEILKSSSVYVDKNNRAGINSDNSFFYNEKNYSEDIALWKAPNNWLRIEFDGLTASEVKPIISEVVANVKALDMDYCITSHEGQSPYINICHIKGMPLSEKNRIAKDTLLYEILPKSSEKALDKTNLSFTWTPVIEHPHWKPKYGGKIHKIVRGKNPVEHENKYPARLLRLIEKQFKARTTSKVKNKYHNGWCYDFLINYCVKNVLPQGSRNNTIAKNLAIAIADNEQAEEIMREYCQTQSESVGSVKSWYKAVLQGKYSEINSGELKTYIDSNNIPYKIKSKKSDNSSKKQVESIDVNENFHSKNLLLDIKNELDKTHKLDDREKLAVFLVRVSGKLLPDERCSAALKGDSSAGKDNVVKTVFSHFPSEDSFILTRGTQSALEEKANDVEAIAFSEINANRENGANKELTEFFKQLSEGGVNVMLRDKNTNEVINRQSEQKSLFYGTTELETDDELQTRYVVIPIRGSITKNQIVVNSVLKEATNFDSLKNNVSWISSSISVLNKNLIVKVPFMDLLIHPIFDGKNHHSFFDLSKERIKRDVKRLISLTKAVAWIHQKQRKIIEKDNLKILLAEPNDFLTAVVIFKDFFDATYEGVDARYNSMLDTIRNSHGSYAKEIKQLGYGVAHLDWTIKSEIQKKSGLNKETFKKRIQWLKNEGYVETFYDSAINGKTSLIQVGKEVGKESVISRYWINVYPLLTHYFTQSKITELYGKSKGELLDWSFIYKLGKELNVFSKKDISLFENLPTYVLPSKETPTEVGCDSSEQDNTITMDLKPNKSISSFDEYFSVQPERILEVYERWNNDYNMPFEIFGKHVGAAVKEGLIYEPKRGQYARVQ